VVGAVLLGLAGGPLRAWAQDELFVANDGTNSITVYTRTASGDTAPLRTLSGALTGLSSPRGVVVDLVNNELVVTNGGNHSITVYTRTASGDTAPLRTLSGALTGLSTPRGVVVDTVNNELFVANDGTNSITVYTRTASGNTAPLRTLSGGLTGLNVPEGVVVDRVNNELVVGNFGTPSITVYTRTASGNTAPLRTLSGALTGLNGPAFIAVTTTATLTVSVSGAGTYEVTSNPGGITCATGNTGSCTLASGTDVTLTASPTGGTTFGGWGGDCAGFGTALICTLTMDAAKAVTAAFTPPPPTISPTASVALNGSAFRTGQTITYQATLIPGSTPPQVDIYLGALLPDGVTFVSLMQVSPGVISFALGPSPIPFSANVTLTQAVVPFSYTFNGFEPVGTYLMYAGLVIAGTDPFQPANHLSIGIQAFQFNP